MLSFGILISWTYLRWIEIKNQKMKL
jgi:hypothetical protein